ncbi:hypothetical protein [Lichenihabitans psoromatis]|uniref:hypothetical protein n=1 Tax=Lichenihabitans psoromatis TaxID=2528642 RepID=UPI001A94BEE1|nr:hypothetical protein [Lichenihabitans psoromatis]
MSTLAGASLTFHDNALPPRFRKADFSWMVQVSIATLRHVPRVITSLARVIGHVPLLIKIYVDVYGLFCS